MLEENEDWKVVLEMQASTVSTWKLTSFGEEPDSKLRSNKGTGRYNKGNGYGMSGSRWDNTSNWKI
jgi:hypothetical protein